MKSVTICALLGVLSLSFCGYVRAEDTAAAPAPAAAAPAADTPGPKAAATLQERMASAIKTQIAAAEKLLTQANEEMAKPDDKRDAAKSFRLKLSAARAYMKIAQTAKTDAARLKADEKKAFMDQYEQPNREKATQLFLELAAAAKEKKDYANAIAFYQEVLAMDPKNAAATDGLKAIADAMKPAPATTGTAGKGNGNWTNTWGGGRRYY